MSILDERGWTEARLSKQCGIAQSLISMHISGKRAISRAHFKKYLSSLNHHERPGLLNTWLRDNMSSEAADDLLSLDGNLALNVKAWLPALNENDKRMLIWWACEIERDDELRELFKLLSVRAGYRGPQSAAGARRRRNTKRTGSNPGAF